MSVALVPITDELPVTGWALDYLQGRKLPTGARLLAMYFAGWAYGLLGQWPPDRMPSSQVIALELRCTERTAKKYLQLLDDVGFLAELDRRRGLS
jgi:hypothetical protein